MLNPPNKCNRDGECEGKYKCCPGMCGKICLLPQKGKEWVGVDRTHLSSLFGFKAHGQGVSNQEPLSWLSFKGTVPYFLGQRHRIPVALILLQPVWIRAMGK